MVIVDIECSGERTNSDQAWLRRHLCLAGEAFEASGIERPVSEGRGDGILLPLPSWVSKVALLGPFVDALAAGLPEHARAHGATGPLRLRVPGHAEPPAVPDSASCRSLSDHPPPPGGPGAN